MVPVEILSECKHYIDNFPELDNNTNCNHNIHYLNETIFLCMNLCVNSWPICTDLFVLMNIIKYLCYLCFYFQYYQTVLPAGDRSAHPFQSPHQPTLSSTPQSRPPPQSVQHHWPRWTPQCCHQFTDKCWLHIHSITMNLRYGAS